MKFRMVNRILSWEPHKSIRGLKTLSFEEYKRYCTLSRAGTPGEVAELVAFLASDRSSYINAQAISVDGGI